MNSVSTSTVKGIYERNIDQLIRSLERPNLERYTVNGEGERNINTNNITFSMGMGSIISDDLGVPMPISRLKIKSISIIATYYDEETNEFVPNNLQDYFFIGNRIDTPQDYNEFEPLYYKNDISGIFFEINGNQLIDPQINNVFVTSTTRTDCNIFTIEFPDTYTIPLNDDDLYITSLRKSDEGLLNVRLRFSILLIKNEAFISLESDSIYANIAIKRNQ